VLVNLHLIFESKSVIFYSTEIFMTVKRKKRLWKFKMFWKASNLTCSYLKH